MPRNCGHGNIVEFIVGERQKEKKTQGLKRKESRIQWRKRNHAFYAIKETAMVSLELYPLWCKIYTLLTMKVYILIKM